MQQEVTGNTSNNKTLIKAVIYFVAGLVFGIFGLIIGGLIIGLKDKSNQKAKIFPLIAGFIASSVFWSFIGSQTSYQDKMFTTLFPGHPEVIVVRDELQQLFPESAVGVNFKKHLSTGTGGSESEDILEVTIETQENIASDMLNKTGKATCKILEDYENEYDAVTVFVKKTSDKVVLSTYVTQEITKTCDEWVSSLPQPLP